MTLSDLYPGAEVIIDGPRVHMEGRVESVQHIGRPEQTWVSLWGDLGGMLFIPADQAHLLTIEEVER